MSISWQLGNIYHLRARCHSNSVCQYITFWSNMWKKAWDLPYKDDYLSLRDTMNGRGTPPQKRVGLLVGSTGMCILWVGYIITTIHRYVHIVIWESWRGPGIFKHLSLQRRVVVFLSSIFTDREGEDWGKDLCDCCGTEGGSSTLLGGTNSWGHGGRVFIQSSSIFIDKDGDDWEKSHWDCGGTEEESSTLSGGMNSRGCGERVVIQSSLIFIDTEGKDGEKYCWNCWGVGGETSTSSGGMNTSLGTWRSSIRLGGNQSGHGGITVQLLI